MAASSSGSGDRNTPVFKVAVESIFQRRIKEITYEGEEIYEEYVMNYILRDIGFVLCLSFIYMYRRKRPSQILTSLADRVDFRDDEEDGPAPKRNIVEKWPWEAVHSKLRLELSIQCSDRVPQHHLVVLSYLLVA